MNEKTYHIFFSTLSNPLRIDIVSSLRKSPKTVGEISEELNVEQSKVSHALNPLKCCKVVEVKQEGKNRVYSLNKKTIVPILELIDKHAKTFCNGNCQGCKR
jgi:DNA-binding transcriptional ArsR family regulator